MRLTAVNACSSYPIIISLIGVQERFAMARCLVSLLLCLLLSSCFVSERFEIPTALLVQPQGLVGRYWNLADAPNNLGIEEFAFTADGGVVLTEMKESEADEAEPMHGRLVSLTDSGAFLLIMDRDEDFQYLLLERRENGIWVLLDIEVPGEVSFWEASEAHADAIAARHGLTLVHKEGERIEGNVNAENVLGLFRDPEFLSSLSFEVQKIFLPMHSEQQRPSDFETDLTARHGPALGLEPAIEALSGAVQPAGVAGTYLYWTQSVGNALDFVRIAEARDGSLDVWRGNERLYSLLLIPAEGKQDSFSAVKVERYKRDDGGFNLSARLSWLERGPEGLKSWPLQLRAAPVLPEIERMQHALARTAASRYGMGLEGSTLKKVKDVDNLRRLFADQQFAAGLDIDRDWVERFTPEDQIQRGFEAIKEETAAATSTK